MLVTMLVGMSGYLLVQLSVTFSVGWLIKTCMGLGPVPEYPGGGEGIWVCLHVLVVSQSLCFILSWSLS